MFLFFFFKFIVYTFASLTLSSWVCMFYNNSLFSLVLARSMEKLFKNLVLTFECHRLYFYFYKFYLISVLFALISLLFLKIVFITLQIALLFSSLTGVRNPGGADSLVCCISRLTAVASLCCMQCRFLVGSWL